MLRSVRKLIERVVPWYDTEREAARDARSSVALERAERTADALRESYRRADGRLVARGQQR